MLQVGLNFHGKWKVTLISTWNSLNLDEITCSTWQWCINGKYGKIIQLKTMNSRKSIDKYGETVQLKTMKKINR